MLKDFLVMSGILIAVPTVMISLLYLFEWLVTKILNFFDK